MTQLNELASFDKDWYIQAEDADQELFRKWLLNTLTEHIVTVTFTKLNGEQRVMECTLKKDIIPNTDPKENAVLCTVWDVNKSSWRSFRFDRINDLNYSLD